MSVARGTIELFQGNETVRRLTSAALKRAGFDVRSETNSSTADLLIIDVSSGKELPTELREKYAEAEKPILFCGVRGDREDFLEETWIDRPYAQNTIISMCAKLVGPADLPGKLVADDDPITREMQYEEAIELEAQLGLNSGALADPPPMDIVDDAEDDVLSLDEHGSSIIAVEELSSLVAGGKLMGAVKKRAVDSQELSIVDDVPLKLSVRNPTFNQTMPDSPMALGNDTLETGTQTAPSIVPPPPDDVISGAATEVGQQVKSVAKMLAESWNRIAGSARVEDRADHIERVLMAMIQQGTRGAASELRRIPGITGFAGDLQVLGVIDLLRTIRDRRMRGRLELSVNDGTYVLYLEGGELADVETLSGSMDLLLLDTLRGMGKLDERVHSELSQAYATGAFLEPVELKLRRDGLVDEVTLRDARTNRVKATFAYLCGVRRGEFAFLPVQPNDGLPWPPRGLRLSVDALLLEILRESSLDTGDSQATARTRLVLDAARTSTIHPSMLTEEEIAVLKYFRDGETVGNVLEQLSLVEVDKIVHRLKSMELLKRSNPFIQTPDLEVADSTVVSRVSDSISRHERKSEKRDDQTTHLKESFAIGPEVVDESFEDLEDARTGIVKGEGE